MKIALTTIVHQDTKRQLGGLTDGLQIVKGVMNKASPALKVSSAAAIPKIDTCADAVDKIKSALTLSSNFMKASGDKPTIGNIQAVLVTLQESLGSECAADDDEDDDDDRK